MCGSDLCHGPFTNNYAQHIFSFGQDDEGMTPNLIHGLHFMFVCSEQNDYFNHTGHKNSYLELTLNRGFLLSTSTYN